LHPHRSPAKLEPNYKKHTTHQHQALDSPGEWYMDEASRVLYVWMPDGGPPAGRVGIKVRDYCINHDGGGSAGAPFGVSNLTMFGCTFKLTNCSGCSVDTVSTIFPTYQRTIPNMGVTVGPVPPGTLLEGDENTVSRFHMRYSNNGGLKIVGNNNSISESLFEDLTWLGTLDFPPIELGFGATQPTRAAEPTASASSAPPARLQQAAVVAMSAAQTSMRLHSAPQLAALAAIGDQTKGNNNTVTRTTVRRCGEMGILTSQRSNTISFTHVHHIGLIGLDSAGLHADNTPVSCMNYALPPEQRTNCTKHWYVHSSLVATCRVKPIRILVLWLSASRGHQGVVAPMIEMCGPLAGCVMTA
jgi:hypothetical protein